MGQTGRVRDFHAQKIADIKHVHSAHAVSRDVSRGNLEGLLAQGACDVMQQAWSVATVDLDDRVAI